MDISISSERSGAPYGRYPAGRNFLSAVGDARVAVRPELPEHGLDLYPDFHLADGRSRALIDVRTVAWPSMCPRFVRGSGGRHQGRPIAFARNAFSGSIDVHAFRNSSMNPPPVTWRSLRRTPATQSFRRMSLMYGFAGS